MSQMTELLQLLQMSLKRFTNAVQTLLLLLVTVVLVYSLKPPTHICMHTI